MVESEKLINTEYQFVLLHNLNQLLSGSKDKPERVAMTVQYCGYWFSINDTDMKTKLFYIIECIVRYSTPEI